MRSHKQIDGRVLRPVRVHVRAFCVPRRAAAAAPGYGVRYENHPTGEHAARFSNAPAASATEQVFFQRFSTD